MKLISKSIKIVDITKKEITEEMLEQYDNLNESVVDDVLADVEDDVYNEEADLRFSNFSQTTTNSEQSLPTTAEESVGEKIAAAMTKAHPTDARSWTTAWARDLGMCQLCPQGRAVMD